MDSKTLTLIIVGMTVVTAIPRLIPVLALARRELPNGLVKWLDFVPPAVLAAMIVPSLLLKEGTLNLSVENLYFVAAIPTTLVAWRSKSIALTALVGISTLAFIRSLA